MNNPDTVRVSHVMSRNARMIGGMATIEEAIREMRENSLSALVVDDARNPVGIVTLRDMVYGLSDEPD